MPKMSRVRAHGSQAGQQSNTEIYRSLASYKTLTIKDDVLNNYLKEIYANNIWNLKGKFEALSAYYDEIGISSIIIWNEGIQYLDFDRKPSFKKVSLNALIKGEYKSIATDKPNTINTEKIYGNRIKFFIKIFDFLRQYADNDDFSWILDHHREYYIIIIIITIH